MLGATLMAGLAFVLISFALQRRTVQFLAAHWLSGALKAEATYDAIRVSPGTGIDLRGVAVRGWPTAASSFYSKRIVISPDWRELAKGALRFRSVRVEGWAVMLMPGQTPEREDDSRARRGPLSLEVVDLVLHNGTVFPSVHAGVPVRLSTLEGLVRIGASESSIRLRHFSGSIGDRIGVQGEVSLWRLGEGPWDAQIAATSDAGAVNGTASSADGRWTWNVAARSMDVATWAQAIGVGTDSCSGIARVEASGQGLEARGSIIIQNPGMRGWRADEASASFRVAPGLVVARTLSLRQRRGELRGDATIRAAEDGWIVRADLQADSIMVALPHDHTDTLVVSGRFDLSGSLPAAQSALTASVRRATVGWRSWRAEGIDADLRLDGDTLRVASLTIGSGTLSGSAHGWVSPAAVMLQHDLWVSLPSASAPFLAQSVRGLVHAKGSFFGALYALGWRGTILSHAPGFGQLDAGSCLFVGRAERVNGHWGVFGAAEVRDLTVSGRRVFLAARANVHATHEGARIGDAVIVRPGGVVIRADGEWAGSSGRIDRLAALSNRWAVAAVGGTSIRLTEQGLSVPTLRVATSAGGFVEMREIAVTRDAASGLALVNHIPVDAVAEVVGVPGPHSGRCYAVIRAGAAIHGWIGIRDFRRLPAMRDFPVDVDLQFSRDPAQTVVRSLTITHGDLRVTGAGRVDSSGNLDAWVRTDESPLGKVLILSDELLKAGLRPIFDARTGTISAMTRVGGTTRQPSFSGDITVDGGAEVTVKPLRTVFRSVRGSGRWEGHSIIIDEVGGVAGKGKAQLKGRLELPRLVLNAASFDIEGRLQEFRLLRGIYGIYDADMKLTKRGKGIGLEGEARLIEGLIDLPSIPIEPMPPSEASMDDQWFVRIVADRGVWVRDRFLNAEVAGRVVLTKENGLVALQGDLEVLRGTYLYLGRKFVLQRGRVSFLGGPLIVPELDVSATTVVRAEGRDGDDITLTLTVTGRVDDPVLRVSADDERYNEEQIKTMLLFNLTPQDVVSLWQGDAFAKEAAGAVEEFLAGELVRVLRAEAGLDELEVSPSLLSSEDRDLYVRMGKYLTPDLFVSVGKGLRSLGLDEVRVEYLLRAWARRMGLGKNVDLKLVGERTHDEFSRTNYQVQMKLKYKF